MVASRVGSERELGPGELVDRYRIEQVIASGGMARVYRAVHHFTGHSVALKVMRTRYSGRPDLIERFHKEAMALSQIRHSNVVAIENGGVTPKGEVFIAMELLEGRTLRELLEERGRLPVREALSVLCQVAHGVSAAHDVNVIHRDLKPENIFCSADGAVKVLDLGLAKFIGHDPKESNDAIVGPIGTAAYISPERLDGMPADVRSDIYSLGLIAYECLAGRHPMAPDGVWPSRQEIALRQLTYSPAPITELPSELWAAVARAIDKNPDRRFSSMDEIAAVLHRVRHELGELERRAVPRSRPIWAAAAAFELTESELETADSRDPASRPLGRRRGPEPGSRRFLASWPRHRVPESRMPDRLPWRHLLYGAALGLFVSCSMFFYGRFAKSSEPEASIATKPSAATVSGHVPATLATTPLPGPSALPALTRPRSGIAYLSRASSALASASGPRTRTSGASQSSGSVSSEAAPPPAASPTTPSRDAASAVLEIWPPAASIPSAASRPVDRPLPSSGPPTPSTPASKLPSSGLGSSPLPAGPEPRATGSGAGFNGTR